MESLRDKIGGSREISLLHIEVPYTPPDSEVIGLGMLRKLRNCF